MNSLPRIVLASRSPKRIEILRREGVDFESLEALPGVGHKTASVVVAQAFGRPAFPVDTHIHRLARNGRADHRKAKIARLKITLFQMLHMADWIEFLMTRQMHLAVFQHNLA